MTTFLPTIDVRRAGDRFPTQPPWLESHHSFSFSSHYDPASTGGLVPIASGRDHHAAISMRQRDAGLWGGRLQPGETVPMPDARMAHVFVPRGAPTLEGAGHVDAGDVVRRTAVGAPLLTAGAKGAEVLIWGLGS